MSHYRAKIVWKRTKEDFSYDAYERDHTVTFGGGTTIAATAAPEYKGDPAKVNPEEMFVAALSNCHMLTFLAICARKKHVVDTYEDDAEGVMTKNEKGKFWVSKVSLRPQVTFKGAPPPKEELDAIHHAAHANCFIALSVKTDVVVEPR